MNTISITSFEALISHLKTQTPTLYTASKTSTVIPYDQLEKTFSDLEVAVADISTLPSSLSISGNILKIKGPVTWSDAIENCRQSGKDVMTSPTEKLACITAGAATSATGERCFAYGNLRKQILSILYLDSTGQLVKLHRSIPLSEETHGIPESLLSAYNNCFQPYLNFKNAPFPRLQQETDLMIGTEGQLGIITEIELEVIDYQPITYLFILLPRWETDYTQHMELFWQIQQHRNTVISCELADANAFMFVQPEEKLGVDQDVLFLEVYSNHLDQLYETFLSQLDTVSSQQIYEINEIKYHRVRAGIPRATFERNSQKKVVKKGTDVQVKPAHFTALLDFYRQATHLKVPYNLFGHFGDAHLHFNFLPTPDQVPLCDKYLLDLYSFVVRHGGSPFAEHGIGLLKRPYIKKFYQSPQVELFKHLKATMDPYNQFFPQGFMSEGIPR